MPYNAVPEKASQRSNAVNELVYGADNIAGVQESFGISKTPIYIYNIANMEHNVPRPPNHPHLLIRRCPKNEEYKLVGQIEHPFNEIEYDQNQNRLVRLVDGYREATKMLSPLNPGTDQDFDIISNLHYGLNLNTYGVFWSTSNPPQESEVEAAKRRLEKTYRTELERMSDAKTADEARQMANNISHAAADYYNVSNVWHQSDLIPKNVDAGRVDCWACGEKIQASALICIHCRAPQAEEKRDKWLDAQTSPGRK